MSPGLRIASQWKNLGKESTWSVYTLLGKEERGEWEKALGKDSTDVGYYCSWLFDEMGSKAIGTEVKAILLQGSTREDKQVTQPTEAEGAGLRDTRKKPPRTAGVGE